MKLKKWFAQLKTIGFFGSGAGIAISAAATKSPTEVVVGASVGSVCGTGINFSFESLEGAADIADRKGVICRIIAALTEFKEDIVDLDLTSGEDSGQLREVNRLIKRANILFAKSPYFHSLIETALQGLLSITSGVLYSLFSFNKDDDPNSPSNLSYAISTGLFLFAQFALHFFCTKEIMNFTQEVENLRKNLTCFCDDVGFLGWEHKILQKKISMLQNRLDQLAARNEAIGEQKENHRVKIEETLAAIKQLLQKRFDLEKSKDEIELKIVVKNQQPTSDETAFEQKQREIGILQKEREQLAGEINNIDTKQKPQLDSAVEELGKRRRELSQEIGKNEEEIAQKQLWADNIKQKIAELHSILVQRAEKCAKEHEKIRDFLSSAQP